MNATPEPKTKVVTIGGEKHEIPAHMSIAGIVECWKNDSARYEALARTIVENDPTLAWLIVRLWVEKHDEYIVPRSYFPPDDVVTARALAYVTEKRKQESEAKS